jgi:hypothetical protein
MEKIGQISLTLFTSRTLIQFGKLINFETGEVLSEKKEI